MTHKLVEEVYGATDAMAFAIDVVVAKVAENDAEVDKVLEIVDGVVESLRALQLFGLTAVLHNLRIDAALGKVLDDRVADVFVAGILTEDEEGDVVGGSVVVGGAGLLLADVAGLHPRGKRAEPLLQFLCARTAETLLAVDETDGLNDVQKVVGIDDARTTTFAAVATGDELVVLEVGDHAGLAVEEPGVDLATEGVVVLLVARGVVGAAEGAGALDEFFEARKVVLFVFGIGLAVAHDVGAVGMVGIGPEVDAEGFEVMAVAAAGGGFVGDGHGRHLAEAVGALRHALDVDVGHVPKEALCVGGEGAE